MRKRLTKGGFMRKHPVILTLIFLLPVIFACIPTQPPTQPQEKKPTITETANHLTATALGTSPPLPPLPATSTPVNSSATIIPILNLSIYGVDTLAATIEAKYQVIDIIFEPSSKENNSNNDAFVMIIYIDCQGVYRPCCSPERTVGVLMHAFKNQNDIASKYIPSTVKQVTVVTLDHMRTTAKFHVKWSDVQAYIQGRITGDQLGHRIPTPLPP
jgi:hypothetical protein